jgi:hypothetical protein
VRKFALLDVLDPGAKDTDRDLMFLFARHRAGVTTDAAVLIDDKSVSHLSTFTLLCMPGKHFSFDIIADPRAWTLSRVRIFPASLSSFGLPLSGGRGASCLPRRGAIVPLYLLRAYRNAWEHADRDITGSAVKATAA